jgi:hypothetical protein
MAMKPPIRNLNRHGLDCLIIMIKQDGTVWIGMRSWFNGIRLILKISFKYHLMNEFVIFLIGLNGY